MSQELYDEKYHEERNFEDPKRLAQFLLDGKFIRKHVEQGTCCDVGCASGEFLRAIEWQGDVFGMEISEYARDIAAAHGVRFDKDILTEQDFFDVVVFRGTIQHVDEPFRMIKASYTALRPGGYVVFLATPNADSPLYKLKGTLPFLDPKFNFFIPGATELANALTNYGFEVVETEFLYLETPYSSPLRDHVRFVRNVVSRRFFPHAFWKSSMSMIARK